MPVPRGMGILPLSGENRGLPTAAVRHVAIHQHHVRERLSLASEQHLVAAGSHRARLAKNGLRPAHKPSPSPTASMN